MMLCTCPVNSGVGPLLIQKRVALNVRQRSKAESQFELLSSKVITVLDFLPWSERN
jgi:hypothetical protein